MCTEMCSSEGIEDACTNTELDIIVNINEEDSEDE